MSRATWDLKRFRTMVRLVQAITVCSREMRRAIRVVTTRLGPVVMKWSHSLHQSLRGSTELQPDWSAECGPEDLPAGGAQRPQVLGQVRPLLAQQPPAGQHGRGGGGVGHHPEVAPHQDEAELHGGGGVAGVESQEGREERGEVREELEVWRPGGQVTDDILGVGAMQ